MANLGLRPSTMLEPSQGLRPQRRLTQTVIEDNDNQINLQEGQYEIGGLVFGTRDPRRVKNPYLVTAFDITPGTLIAGTGGNLSSSSGSAGTYTADASYPNEDGTKFGQDYYTGQLLTWSIDVWQRNKMVYDQIGALKGIWRNKAFRNTSNVVTTCRICRGGRTRLAYGRPRNFKETYGEVERGWSPIDCDFQCTDECFYDDEIKIQNIGIQNPPVDGLTFPATVPWVLSQYQENYTTVHVEGDLDTWPMFVIHGPISNPTIQYDNDWQIELLVSLDHTQTVTIDPRPWFRRTLLQGAAIKNISGAYTQDSPVMRNMRFSPGRHTVLFGGLDSSLTSYVTVSWRDAYGTP